MPTALLGGEGFLGIISWFRWAIPFVFNLWPYFSDFIVSSTFWVLGVPMLTVVTVRIRSSGRSPAAEEREEGLSFFPVHHVTLFTFKKEKKNLSPPPLSILISLFSAPR